MFLDIIIVLLFFALRLPISQYFAHYLSPITYRLLADTLIIISMLALLRIKNPLSKALMGWKKVSRKDIEYGLLGSIILAAISLSIIKIVPQKQFYDEIFTLHSYKIYTLLVISSITEELFYRAFLLKRIVQSHISPSIAILISAIIFAMGHMYMGIGGIIFSFASGILLAYALIRFRSISLLIISHTLYNIFFYTMRSYS